MSDLYCPTTKTKTTTTTTITMHNITYTNRIIRTELSFRNALNRQRQRRRGLLDFHMNILVVLTICIQIQLSFLPAAVSGLTSSSTTTPIMMTNSLSPMESILLHSRLEKIKNGIQNDYSSIVTKANEISRTIDAEATAEEISTTMTTTTYIFPGAGGVDDLILELHATIPNSIIIDWKEYRGNILTASYDSEVVGQAIAELIISKNNNNKSKSNSNSNSNSNESTSCSSDIHYHFIGISVGGFAANAAATEVYRQQQQQQQQNNIDDVDVDVDANADINLTLLDPFCGRGIFQPNYGRDYFGKYATTAIQIMNTDDPVPTTNEPLPYCYCLDVTNSLKRNNFIPSEDDSMHSWPLAYYIRHYYNNTSSSNKNENENENNFPRGTVIKIS
ncbi:MAG: hypothetical protein ACI90V_005354 [Bacillariaceae sp.]